MADGARYAAGGLTAARDDFVRRFPAYAATGAVDELRAADYSRLDRLGHTYLDYTGGGLYGDSQLRRHREVLETRVLGNPHSQSPTSQAAAELAAGARDAVRRFFHAPEDEFEIVFTANASGALKLVGEAYPFAPGGVFLLSYDNHNSVNGIREFAGRKGAAATYIPVREDDLRIDAEQVGAALRGAGGAAAGQQAVRLPGAVQLQRRPAPAGMGGRGSRPGLGRDRRLRGLRADQPRSMPQPSAPTSSRSRSTSSSVTRPAPAA